jgi:hypothetical protein
MTEEQNTLPQVDEQMPAAEQPPVDSMSEINSQVMPDLAKPVNVPGQSNVEPDDMFGDIDSLKVETPVSNPQQSITEAQSAIPVSGGGVSLILMKLLIVLVVLAVLAGAAVLAYPYVTAMFSGEEEVIIIEPDEMVVDNAYNFPEEDMTIDYGVTDEMIATEEDSANNGNPLPAIGDQTEDDLMVDVDAPLSEIIGGATETGTEDETTEDVSGATVSVDLNKDTDNDGLTDEEEKKLGTHIMKADTDNDGLSDRDEVMIHKTNPTEYDTDGDGLSDYDELMIYKSNPLVADTDEDGYTDGVEVSGGYNPNGPGKLEIK